MLVIADKDDAGRRHAADVARILNGHVPQLGVFEAADGSKDLADHIAAGHTLDELVCIPPNDSATAQPRTSQPMPPDDDQPDDVEPLSDLPSDDYGKKILIEPPSAPLSVAQWIYRRFRLENSNGAKTLVCWRC